MKTILLFFFTFSICYLTGQTVNSLPPGSQPYSGTIYNSPDGTLWTGKSGSYTAIAKKTDVPDIDIKPSDLGITGFFQLPVPQSLSEWRTGGIPYSPLGTPSVIVQRDAFGKLVTENGTSPTHAVNKRQLDSVANIATQGFDPMNNNTSVNSNYQRSRILNSSSSNMTQSFAGNNSVNNLILGSSQSNLIGSRTVQNTAILASDRVTINGGRIQTAIIASTEAEIQAWTSPSTLKWNSAIVASHGGVIQSSNSYTLVTGKRTQSSGSAQFVCGQSNIIEPSLSVEDPLKKAFIVGNGTGDVNNPSYPGTRSNAFYVQQNGNAWVQNQFEIGKAGGGLVLKSPNGTRYILTVDNSGNLSVNLIQ